MIHRFATTMIASMLCAGALCGIAHAANPSPVPLPIAPESRLVAASNAPTTTTSPALPLAFTIATAEDLQVTLTDQQIPAALTSASIVVTQGDAIAGSATFAAPATSATFSITGAVGSYTLWVFGAPGANFSEATFVACVAPKSTPSACISSASTAGVISTDSSAKDPTVSTLSTTLTVTTPGPYTFNFADLKFPVPLDPHISPNPNLALFQGSIMIAPPPPIASGTALTLAAGTYTLLAIAKADPTAQAGLYGLTITGPPGTTPLCNGTVCDSTIPVGLIGPAQPFDNPAAQSVTLKVTDFAFPGKLASAMALLTSGATPLSQASAGTAAAPVMAPKGALNAWPYASPGATPGTYEVDVAGSTDLYTTAQGVTPSGSNTYAYGFVTAPQPAGSYQAAATDLQFPSTLTGLSFAVAQGGVILKGPAAATAGTLPITTPSAGPVVFLASAQVPAAGATGLLDVNLQTSGASPTLLYDKTQSVSSTPSILDSQTVSYGADAAFNATLTDLKFPAAFDNLAMVVSRAGVIVGKIFGGGTFSFPSTPGNYQLTFVATPAAQQQFGLYGISVGFAPPAITTFTASPSNAAKGTPVTLSWTTTNATSCSGSGGSWTVSPPGTSGSQAVVLSATTTYKLSCTGAGGGMASQSVTVTATAAPGSGGGGGALEWDVLALSGSLLLVRSLRRRALRATHWPP